MRRAQMEAYLQSPSRILVEEYRAPAAEGDMVGLKLRFLAGAFAQALCGVINRRSWLSA
jgi:hypothetical protein